MERRSLVVVTFFLVASVSLGAGCGNETPGRRSGEGNASGNGKTGNGEPELLDSTEVARVKEVCSACHMFPDPAGLPRHRWERVIPTMVSMPLPEGVERMSAEDVDLSQRYYAAHAPEQMDPPRRAPRSTGGLHFEVEQFTPQEPKLQRNRLPAVSFVSFEPLHRPDRKDLLICDFRTQTIFLQSPWASHQEHREIHRGFMTDMNYPSRINATDLTGNGRTDFLVASVGNMIPRNHQDGAVFGLFQTRENHWEPQLLEDNLARATDARAADFNGNGRLDLVVCAFGWRGPGELVLLENTSEDPFQPSYERHQLDSRDGWIHAVPYDVEGNGRKDILALVAQEHQQVVWFRNKGQFEFEPIVLYEAPHPVWALTGLELVDLNGNGRTDILVSNGDSLDDNIVKPYHGVGWLKNEGRGEGAERFAPYERIADVPGCMRAVAADMNNNGRKDIVAVSWIPQRPPENWEAKDLASVVWIEQTERGWRTHTIERHMCMHPALAVADYNGNGLKDIAVGNYVWMRQDDEGNPRYRADYITLFTQVER